jgi:hypothetical protein
MPPVDLHGELWRAMRFAKAAAADDPLTANLLTCVLPFRGMQWGFGLVTFYGVNRELYELQPDGKPAIIVPVVEDGDTIDLCAIDPDSQHIGTRLDVGRALGLDAIERARFRCCDLHLVDRPLTWLHRQARTVDERRRYAVEAQRVRAERSGEDVPLPDDYVYLFDLRRLMTVLDGVAQFTVDGYEFGERIRALFPPSQRERVLVAP